MGTFEEKSKVQFLIDTKGLCLLCFGDTENNDIFATFSVEGSKHLQLLSRYLNINLGKVLNLQDTLKSEETIPLNNSELLVTLCTKCCDVVKQFSHFYKELHMMQMNLNVTVRKIHDMTIGAEKDEQRLKEYQMRMTAMAKNPLELIQANIVENLRKDIIQKCSTHRKHELPRVFLSRLNRKRALVPESRLPVKKKRPAVVPIFEPLPHPIAGDMTGIDLPKTTRRSRLTYPFITKLDGTTYRDSQGHLRCRYWCHICNLKLSRNLGKHVKQKHPDHLDTQGVKTGLLKQKHPTHHGTQGAGVKKGPFIVRQSFRDKSGYLRYKYYCKICKKRVSGLNSHKNFHQQELSNINYEEPSELTQLNLPKPAINGKIEANQANEKDVPYFFPVTSSRYRDPAGRIKYRRFYCKLCDKTVSSSIHKKVHSGKAYSCNYCPASFKTNVSRNFHIVLTHCEHYFPSLRQPGISKAQFKRAVDQLFVEKLVQGIDGSQQICCHFCDERAHRGRMKIKIRQHMIKFHFHALTSKLLALQKNPSAITPQVRVQKKTLPPSIIKSTDPDASHSCLSCNKVLPSKAEWLKHTRLYCPAVPAPKPVGIASKSHPPSDRVCRHCNQTFRTSTQRTAHQIDAHPATFFTSLQSSVISNHHFKAALETLFESIKIFSLIYESGEEIDYAGCPHCDQKFQTDTEEDKIQYARAHMINMHQQILENKLAQLLKVEEKIGMTSLVYTSQASATVTLPWDTNTASFEGNEDNLVPSGTSRDRSFYVCRFCKTEFSYKRSLIFHELALHSEQSFLLLKPPDLYMEQFKAWIEELFVDLKDVPVVDEEGKMRTAICCPYCEQMSKPKINRVMYIRHHMIQEHYDILKSNLNEILVKNGFSIVENGEFASAPVSDLGQLEELYENEDIGEDDSYDLDLSDSPQVEAILETKIEEEDAEWEQSEPIDNSMLPLDIENEEEEGEIEEPPVATAEMDFIDENEEAMETEEVDPLFILP